MARYLTSLIIFIGISFTIQAEPNTYSATYNVYEDGSLRAVLTSRLKKTGDHQYQVTDITEGTSGLASLLNFKRFEQTDFVYHDKTPEVIRHSMDQKVAFKKKHFEFSHQPGESSYHGIDQKKPFQLNSQQPLLSNQLVSWQLSQQVCHKPKTTMQWQILKSEQAKLYTFKIVAVDNNRILVHRQYPNRSDKTTAIWINTQECYIEEIIYQKDQKVVRTVLKDIVFE